MPKNKIDFFMEAIDWIAQNDEPMCMDIDTIADQLTVVLVADVLNDGDCQSTARWVLTRREDLERMHEAVKKVIPTVDKDLNR